MSLRISDAGATAVVSYNRRMRSRLNLALVGVAGACALVLTAVRQSPEGVLSLELDMREARATPGEVGTNQRHDLSALKLFNRTLLHIKDRYVDSSKIDPKKMLFAALDSVQASIPEVLVAPDQAKNKVTVAVNDKREVFDTDDVDSLWRMTAKLKRIFRFVETNMNAGSDLAKVEYAAINGVLSTLDPHSLLMDPEQARDMDVSTSGKFGGLGIVIRMIERKLTVVKPMKDTPAWKAGVKAGDHIVKINNEPTENFTSNEAVDRMRGDPRTAVTLWVERKGTAGLLRFDLVRDVIRVTQVEHKLLDKSVGYIKVKQFSKGIASDVAEAMKEMSAQGATAWILDLRYNPGGLLEEAVQLSDLFVDSGTVVTTVSGRDREARRAERGFGDTTSSLAVLVNGGSASASEIVAGALKNLDRAAIIGTRTFGKGSVQELYDNEEDHSKLKLTIAQYLTPGDRSIQNLGIVPDIQLQRMYVPEKNDAPADFVRLLAPSRVYGEKDLAEHIVSSYAKDGDKPEYELPFLVEKKKPAAGTPADVKPASDDDDGPDDDDIIEDWEMRFAKEVVAATNASNRLKLVNGATKIVARVRGEEEKKLVTALQGINVDWSGPTGADSAQPNLEVSLTSLDHVKAGDIVDVTATVKNTGTATAYRVLPRLQTDDRVFEDTELPIGKVAPGETRTFTAKVQIPKDAYDRVDRLSLEVKSAGNAPAKVTADEVHIAALPQPVFAYAYQLVDDGNGDGLVQRGEKYHLQLQIKNTGTGVATAPAVVLRNASGDGVSLEKSRAEIAGGLAPGQVKEVTFALATDATLKGDEMVIELIAYDNELDAETKEKLHFKVAPGVTGQPARGEITMKSTVDIRAGASDETSVIGAAPHGASFQAIGTFGPYTKIKLSPTRVGFVPTSAVSSGGAGAGAFTQAWNSTPPMITLATKAQDIISADSYKLAGNATDEQHVEDVYVLVSNQQAKIETRKVFYRSNRGGKDGKLLDFAADVPLWPGSNMITVVARSNSEVRSTKTMYVYREAPRTAQTP